MFLPLAPEHPILQHGLVSGSLAAHPPFIGPSFITRMRTLPSFLPTQVQIFVYFNKEAIFHRLGSDILFTAVLEPALAHVSPFNLVHRKPFS